MDGRRAQEATWADQEFKQHVIRLLNIVRFTQQQHGEMLNHIYGVLPSCSIVIEAPLIEQPFKTLEDLLPFDKKLENEKAATLARELRQLGGRDVGTATK